MKTKLLCAAALLLPISVNAALPTNNDFDLLDQSICGLGEPPIGYFLTKPDFVIKNTNHEVIVKNSKEYGLPACGTGCSGETTTTFSKSPQPSSFSNYNYVSTSVEEFHTSTNRRAIINYSQRGIAIVKAYTNFKQRTSSGNFIYVSACDANYLYVQNKPTVGTPSTYSGNTVVPSGSNVLKVSSGFQDPTFSKNAQQGKPLEYRWSIKNLDSGWLTSMTSTVKSVGVYLQHGGNYKATVRAYDGTYYSPAKSFTFNVLGLPDCGSHICIPK